MFSNRYRFLKMALLLAVIILSCHYSYLNLKDSQLFLRDCMEEPEKCDNKTVVIANKWAVREIRDGGFEVSLGNRNIFVNYPPEGIVEGDYVSAIGIFHKEGHFDAESLHAHRLLAEKWALSLSVAILIAFAFFRSYRFDFRKFEFRRR